MENNLIKAANAKTDCFPIGKHWVSEGKKSVGENKLCDDDDVYYWEREKNKYKSFSIQILMN